MTTIISQRPRTSRLRAPRGQRVEFGLIYAVTLVIFIAAVLVRRVFDFVIWRHRTEPARSILREARDSAGAAVPYAFMG